MSSFIPSEANAPFGCADLTIVQIEEPDWIHEEESTMVKVTVKNIGSAASPATVLKIVDYDPAVKEIKKLPLEYQFKKHAIRHAKQNQEDKYIEASVKVPSLKAKEERVLSIQIDNHWVYDPDCELLASIDKANEVPECNEKNNEKFFMSSQ